MSNAKRTLAGWRQTAGDSQAKYYYSKQRMHVEWWRVYIFYIMYDQKVVVLLFSCIAMLIAYSIYIM